MEPIRTVIPAGGSSIRMNGVNKLVAKVAGLPVIVRTIKAFDELEYIEQIVVVVPKEQHELYLKLLKEYKVDNKVKFAYSGLSRQESVFNGLKELSDDEGIVLIHDAARPLVTKKIIDDCIEGAKRYGFCLAASRNTDTIKRADNIMFVEKTLDRQRIYNAQTPQAFKTEFALDFHKRAQEDNLNVTDDSMIAEYYGHNVKIIESDTLNIKITSKIDLLIAEAFLSNGD
jgi:2-C-methyl-D-erythritol 4-phosphate cytidylyltransferase